MPVEEWRLFPSDAADAPLVVTLLGEEDGESVYTAIRERSAEPFSLLTVRAADWNRDLSPWPAESAFRGGAPFGGGAADFLDRLLDGILPEALCALRGQPPYYALAGYSLAGLFALWAACQTPIFSRLGSMSGSLWFPGFADYALRLDLSASTERIYLSLGDREARTRNTLMRTVEQCTIQLRDHWAAQGIETLYETNPGNHFQDPVGRIARGIAWLLRE